MTRYNGGLIIILHTCTRGKVIGRVVFVIVVVIAVVGTKIAKYGDLGT